MTREIQETWPNIPDPKRKEKQGFFQGQRLGKLACCYPNATGFEVGGRSIPFFGLDRFSFPSRETEAPMHEMGWAPRPPCDTPSPRPQVFPSRPGRRTKLVPGQGVGLSPQQVTAHGICIDISVRFFPFFCFSFSSFWTPIAKASLLEGCYLSCLSISAEPRCPGSMRALRPGGKFHHHDRVDGGESNGCLEADCPPGFLSVQFLERAWNFLILWGACRLCTV